MAPLVGKVVPEVVIVDVDVVEPEVVAEAAEFVLHHLPVEFGLRHLPAVVTRQDLLPGDAPGPTKESRRELCDGDLSSRRDRRSLETGEAVYGCCQLSR